MTPGTALTAASIGAVTCCSTTAGDAPGNGPTTAAIGICRGGINSCFSDVIEMTPKIATSTEARPTRARLRRLSRVSQAMRASGLVKVSFTRRLVQPALRHR